MYFYNDMYSHYIYVFVKNAKNYVTTQVSQDIIIACCLITSKENVTFLTLKTFKKSSLSS